MLDLIHRLGCLIQLLLTGLAAWGLVAWTGLSGWWVFLAALAVGVLGTVMVMLLAQSVLPPRR